ncbi:MAG: response regulator transcription factor [bacterium]|nr:response regulator transcription factor [bacterium]
MRLLLVEDSPDITQFLKPALEAAHFAVDVSEDGERGSYLARTTDYDLIILDNILPKKNGIEVCKEIRQDGKMVPILMISVKSAVSEKVSLLDAGADDYLVKPFTIEELMARVRALLRRPQQFKEDIMTIGDLVIDVACQRVERDQKDVYLTRKEFMLLEYMARHQGTVLSRSMLLEHVWDMNVDPFSNTIESHIASLRRKIDATSKKKLIHTVPSRGYRLDVL